MVGIGAVGCWLGGAVGDRGGKANAATWAMVISGSCAVVIGLLQAAPLPLLVGVGLVWGCAVVADSAQFSAIVTEVADQSYVGTALTLQLAIGFVLTVPTLWLVPVIQQAHGWTAAFTLLAVGPAIGTVAMRRLTAVTAVTARSSR
jgi:MFS family permease